MHSFTYTAALTKPRLNSSLMTKIIPVSSLLQLQTLSASRGCPLTGALIVERFVLRVTEIQQKKIVSAIVGHRILFHVMYVRVHKVKASKTLKFGVMK